MMTTFWEDEYGAVTVDWVVLTAGLVVLSAGALSVISGGVERLSGNVSDTLAGVQITDRFNTLTSILSNSFSDGLGGWAGATQATLAGFGGVLLIGPGQTAQNTVDLPDGTTTATVSFDIIGGDDLSGEPAIIMINGEPVALYADNHGNITTEDTSGAGIEVAVDQHYVNDPEGAGDHGHDSRATYTITVTDPGDSLTLGVASTTGQPTSEEFYAIDDVTVTAS